MQWIKLKEEKKVKTKKVNVVNILNSKKVDEELNYINLDAYVLTNRLYVGSGTDVIKTKLLKEIICKTYEVSFSELLERNRTRLLVDVRHAFCYFMRINTKYSLNRIGLMLGNRDHATVLNGINRYNNFLEYEIFHKKKHHKITEKFRDDMLNVDITKTYMEESEDTISNWKNVKHKYS